MGHSLARGRCAVSARQELLNDADEEFDRPANFLQEVYERSEGGALYVESSYIDDYLKGVADLLLSLRYRRITEDGQYGRTIQYRLRVADETSREVHSARLVNVGLLMELEGRVAENGWRQSPVFVRVIEFLQQPQRVGLWRVLSIARLVGDNEFSCGASGNQIELLYPGAFKLS